MTTYAETETVTEIEAGIEIETENVTEVEIVTEVETGIRHESVRGGRRRSRKVPPVTGTTAAPRRRSPLHKLAGRWPTALAIGLTAVNVAGGSADVAGSADAFGQALLLLPLGYLIFVRVPRRWSWPVAIAAVAAVTAVRALDVISLASFLGTAMLAMLVWSAVRKDLHKPGMVRVQALGAIGFGALALAGLALDPQVGIYLVAAGWFLHGVWDFVHLRLDKVVSRTFAEWCGVVDILVAAQLLLLV